MRFLDINTVIGEHSDQSPHTLTAFLIGVVHRHALGERTAVDTVERQFSDKRVYCDLERQTAQRFFVVGFPFDHVPFFILTLDRGNVQRGRQQCHDIVEKTLYALVSVRTSAQNGGDLHGDRRFTKCRDHLFFFHLFAVKHFHHDVVVVVRTDFRNVLSCFFRLRFHIGGDLFDREVFTRLVVRINESLFSHNVHDSDEIRFFANRQREGHGGGV